MRRSAGDTRMSPALKDAFFLLLVLAHRALNTGLRYLNKVFRKDKKIKKEDEKLTNGLLRRCSKFGTLKAPIKRW